MGLERRKWAKHAANAAPPIANAASVVRLNNVAPAAPQNASVASAVRASKKSAATAAKKIASAANVVPKRKRPGQKGPEWAARNANASVNAKARRRVAPLQETQAAVCASAPREAKRVQLGVGKWGITPYVVWAIVLHPVRAIGPPAVRDKATGPLQSSNAATRKHLAAKFKGAPLLICYV